MDAHQTSIFTAILITCAILAVLITYFVVTIIHHHRRNIDLYKSKIRGEITTMENERIRIAHDLHDELGPELSSVKLRLNNLEVSAQEDIEDVAKINRSIDNIILQMRDISNDLMPSKLERKGLIAAMNDSIENIAKPDELKICFRCENTPELSKEKSIHLYRMLQEIMHNTIKHAKARVLKIELSLKNQTLVVLSEDDGVGFDYNSIVKENTGLGLRSLLSRTEVLGGEMFVESKKGKGTNYIFEIPLP
jgi:signal transduction histidine kinase